MAAAERKCGGSRKHDPPAPATFDAAQELVFSQKVAPGTHRTVRLSTKQ